VTYWLLNAGFLAVVAIVAVAAVVKARRGRGAARLAAATALTLAAVLLLTAVFDNVLVGLGIVDYGARGTSGVSIGVAPIEDFAYAIAAAIGLPSLWVLLGRPGRRDEHR
jgi:lycopene cyclase domain-containing protein